MQQTLIFRLKQFMDHTGLNNSQFADRCGIPRPSFSQIITGRNKKVSDILITQIHNAFPELNILWLMFGDGAMLNVSESDSSDETNAPSGGNSHYATTEEMHFSPFTDANIWSENTNLPYKGSENLKNGRENGAIFDVLQMQKFDLNGFATDLASKISSNLRDEIERPRRRVVRITVFYDDSSYETFSPTADSSSVDL